MVVGRNPIKIYQKSPKIWRFEFSAIMKGFVVNGHNLGGSSWLSQ